MYFEEEFKQKNGSHAIAEAVNHTGKARIARETVGDQNSLSGPRV